MKDSKKMTWYTLAFIAFSGVWGFGNVLNGFVYFNGIQVIFSWILMFALYFIPYTLMVGELGSAFKTSGGGVSSWIHNTMGPKLAYFMQDGPTGHVILPILQARAAADSRLLAGQCSATLRHMIHFRRSACSWRRWQCFYFSAG